MVSDPFPRMTVYRVVKEYDRVLLYKAPPKNSRVPDYYVIDSKTSTIKKGDIIEYEPYGMNFGWFKRKIGGK
jgi:hypothetical protein